MLPFHGPRSWGRGGSETCLSLEGGGIKAFGLGPWKSRRRLGFCESHGFLGSNPEGPCTPKKI